jgi:folate-dependent tRNA-U54 methylase TrmFO/GidA
VGSYLVKSMGIQASLQLLEQARVFFAGKITGEELLAHTPAGLVQGLRAAMAEVFEQRAQLFRPA